jgi:copper chaperone
MTLQFTVPNMACSACADTITKAVKAIDPAAQINADPKLKQVNIDTQANETAIREAISGAGYTIA